MMKRELIFIISMIVFWGVWILTSGIFIGIFIGKNTQQPFNLYITPEVQEKIYWNEPPTIDIWPDNPPFLNIDPDHIDFL